MSTQSSASSSILAEIAPIGDGIVAGAGMWSFKGSAALNFDEHVAKSVPFYHEGHALIRALSEFFVGADSICYEIGCSTATLLESLARQHTNKPARFVGIEIEEDMANAALKKCGGMRNATVIHHDALTFNFCRADLIIAYYTVQFVAPKDRQVLIDKLYQCLNWGGAFLLFEKVRAPDARFQDIMAQSYVEFKLANGYSEREIIGKSRSLKRVLEPFSSDAIGAMLRRAGFQDVMSIMKYLCFEGFLAIK